MVPKNVVFVIDISGSMSGVKMQQVLWWKEGGWQANSRPGDLLVLMAAGIKFRASSMHILTTEPCPHWRFVFWGER